MKENKRFYFKTDTGINEAIEVYIGSNAGKQLDNDIKAAKEEVLIISPYIDERKLDELFNLKNKGINVKLVFSDLRKAQYSSILRKLINQTKITDAFGKKAKENKIRFINIGLLFSGLIIFYIFYNMLNVNYGGILRSKLPYYYLLIAGICIMTYLLWNIRKKIYKQEIYSYKYNENLNFKFIRNPDFNKFIHSKIYVIDRRVAYIGSLNFTNNGFETNFETRVRITQTEKVSELVDFINDIFEDHYNFRKHEISFLGKKVFSESKF